MNPQSIFYSNFHIDKHSAFGIYYHQQQSEVMKLQKAAEPSKNESMRMVSFRLSEEDIEKITFCANALDGTKSDVVRMGIDLIFNVAERIKK